MDNDISQMIAKCTDSLMKNQRYLEMFQFNSIREIMYWGYTLNNMQIEKQEKEIKEQIWNEVKGLELSQEQKIRAAKGLFYFYSYVNQK